jgi:DNA-binding XRE family transcriptional regulator
MKTTSLAELTDLYIGPAGSNERNAFDHELRLDILGDQIKQIRKERHLTQTQLGELIGVKKAQISKIENSLKQARIDTILKVFVALEAKLYFQVVLE